MYLSFPPGQNIPLHLSIPLPQSFLPPNQVLIALFDLGSGLLPTRTCPLNSTLSFCLRGGSGFGTLGLSLTHSRLVLDILPLVTEVCLARSGEVDIAMLSQGTNILPAPFLGFLLGESRLDLYSCFLKADLVTPKLRGSWERVFFLQGAPQKNLVPRKCERKEESLRGGDKLLTPLGLSSGDYSKMIVSRFPCWPQKDREHHSFMESLL